MTDAHLLRRFNEARFALDEVLADRRKQQTPLYTAERGTQRLRVVEVSGDDLSAGLRQIGRFGRALDHRADCGTRAEQQLHDQTSVSSRRTGYKNHMGTKPPS